MLRFASEKGTVLGVFCRFRASLDAPTRLLQVQEMLPFLRFLKDPSVFALLSCPGWAPCSLFGPDCVRYSVGNSFTSASK